MKRKLPLFLAMLMMVSILCSSVAYAASIGGEDIGPGGEVEIDDPNVPLAEVPEVIIWVDATRSGNTSNAVVPEGELEAAINQVVEEGAVRLTIISDGQGDASKAEVEMPGGLIRKMADTGVELNVLTPVGRALLSNEAFQSILHDDDCTPTLVIERKPVKLGHVLLENEDVASDRIDGGSVCLVYVTCPHGTYYSWGAGTITLYLPTGTADFVEGNGYTVRHLDMDPKDFEISDFETEDYTVEDIDTYVGQCVTDQYVGYAEYYGYVGYGDDDGLRVAVTVGNGRLCYFVVLADAVAENVGTVDPAIVVSPVANKTVTVVDNSSAGVFAPVQRWFDSVANQFMKLFGI